MSDDGLAYVREAGWPGRSLRSDGGKGEPEYKMATGLADVPEDLLETCVEAAEECPGECIFIEET